VLANIKSGPTIKVLEKVKQGFDIDADGFSGNWMFEIKVQHDNRRPVMRKVCVPGIYHAAKHTELSPAL